MIRTMLAASLVGVAAGCAARDGEPEFPTTIVINDDAGRPYSPELSPDGTRLAYAMPVDGQSAIHVANVDGSNPRRITHGIWDSDPVWSPDGQWIAYQAEAPYFDVWVVSSEGGEARPLTSGRDFDNPAGWLPDGSAVVFYRVGPAETKTFVVPREGGEVTPLGPAQEGNQFVTVSPDGSRAAFDLHRGGQGTIWVQDLPAGMPRQLTTEGLENALTSRMWSPDGRSLLYTSRRTGTMDLWIADVETGDLRQLTSDIRNDFSARWSPDGRWIVFLSDRGGQSDIWVVPSAGGAAARVTNDLANEVSPQWTGDGRGVLYHRNEISTELHAIPAEGGPARVLVSWGLYTITQMDVSPNGGTVLFTSNRSGNPDIWAVPLAGGEPQPLVTGPLSEFDARWSPDGTRIVFVSDRAGSPDIWVAPASGGEPTRLAGWPSDETEPRWSPDGATIAFTSNRGGSSDEVWTVPAAGGEATRVTRNGAAADDPTWSADGSAILFIGSAPDGTRDVFQVPASGGQPRRLGATATIGLTISTPGAGSPVAYSAFPGGWGFVEVVPVAGGDVRRLTTRTERVYHPTAEWSPDGSRLAVLDYDYAADTYDILTVSWPDGVWRRLTETPEVGEGNVTWTPDGREILFSSSTRSNRIVSVSVAALLGESKD